MAMELHGQAPLLDSAERIADYLREDNRALDVEHFQVLLLNARMRLIRHEHVSQGLLDQVVAHPRDIFRRALNANAHSIVLAHNHPSGDPVPSEADLRLTRDLVRAGQLMRIPIIDHIILGRRNETTGRDYVSLREMGILAG
jgi:DNA repair protein RadC